jgi:hypothetical protein
MLKTYTIQVLEECNLRRNMKLSFSEKIDIIQYIRMAEINLKVDN